MGVMNWIKGWRRGEADCPEVRQHASDYLEGDLSPRLQKRVERHLEWCPQCPKFIRTLQATISSLRALPRRDAPDSLRQRILDETRSSGEGRL